jgi:hypothetical protein
MRTGSIPTIGATAAPNEGRTLLPFSAGPVVCPAREVVLYTASTALCTLLGQVRLAPEPPFPLQPARPLPRGLDPFTLRFAVRPQARR